MLKVGLIGCGGMGATHASCYAALADSARLVAVADLDRERAESVSGSSGAEIYGSGEELIQNADVDVIDICLPTFLHTRHAVLAMEKGRHVFLEKPVCLSMDEAELLLETQKKTGAKVQVGQVVRFWDEYVWLKNACDSGEYGKVLSASFSRLSAHPKWSWENWYDDPDRSGTMAVDMHIHDVDFVRFLLGDPDEVCARAARGADDTIQHIFAMYRFGDVVVTTEGCWDFPDNFPFQMPFRVRLEKAAIVFDGDKLTVYPSDGESFSPDISPEFSQDQNVGINISSQGAYYNELKHFLGCLEKDLPITVAPLGEAVKSLALDLKEIELAGGVRLKK